MKIFDENEDHIYKTTYRPEISLVSNMKLLT